MISAKSLCTSYSPYPIPRYPSTSILIGTIFPEYEVYKKITTCGVYLRRAEKRQKNGAQLQSVNVYCTSLYNSDRSYLHSSFEVSRVD